MNKTFLIGNVGKDPEIKTTNNGKKVTNFTHATTDHSGTQWHNIVACEKTAEIIEKFVRKGSKLAVEGRITYRQWDDKDGNKRSITEIVADGVKLLTPKSDN